MNNKKNLLKIIISLLFIIFIIYSFFIKFYKGNIYENKDNEKLEYDVKTKIFDNNVSLKKEDYIEGDIKMLEKLKSSEPKDYFCAFVSGDKSFDYNLEYIDTIDQYKKYEIGNSENVFVSCPINILDKKIYISFDKNKEKINIKIYDDNGNFLQEIPSDDMYLYEGKMIYTLFFLDDDVNFDNYNDMKIINKVSDKNTIISYLIFDPMKKKFIERDDLKYLYTNNPFSESFFNKDEKTINTIQYINSNISKKNKLKYVDGFYINTHDIK